MFPFLDEDELEEVGKAVAQTVELTVGVLKLVNSHPEFHKLQAAHWRKLYNATIAEGFSQNEAVQLVIAFLKAGAK